MVVFARLHKLLFSEKGACNEFSKLNDMSYLCPKILVCFGEMFKVYMTVFIFYFIWWIESTWYLDNYAGFYVLRYQF